MPSTNVAKRDTNLPEGYTQEDLDAIMAQQEDEFSDDVLITPILKIGQGLTREVQEGNAEAGEFIDSLTSEGLGTKVGFIVAYYQKGRFAADRDTNKAYTAFGDTIPEHWEPLVGAQWVGTRFDEHPDAEEKYAHRVNVEKEMEWGKGPLISTTHNFTGYVIAPGIDGEEDELRPARLSLQRTNNKAVSKWMTLKRAGMRGKAFWDVVFDLGTTKNSYTRGVAYNLTVAKGRPTTPDEKSLAVEMATAVAAGRVQDNSVVDSTKDKAEPDAEGGLAV